MNWKPELDDSIDDLIRVTQGDKVMFTQRDARDAIHSFVATEIIEKLIEETHRYYLDLDSPDMAKQQLRDKWL